MLSHDLKMVVSPRASHTQQLQSATVHGNSDGLPMFKKRRSHPHESGCSWEFF